MDIKTEAQSQLFDHNTDRAMRKKENLRSVAYSIDVLVPGFYLWLGPLILRVGGCQAETSYPGTIHSCYGVALVLPGYRIWTTYQGSFDP